MEGTTTMKILFCTIIFVCLFFTACSTQPNLTINRYQFDDIQDDDLDGVINARDICGQTPLRVHVNNLGCTTWRAEDAILVFDLLFTFNSKALPEKVKPTLSLLANHLNSNDNYRLTIIGDASPEGTIQYNQKLASQRVDAVFQALIERGVDADKVDTHYFNDSQLIVGQFMTTRQHRVLALLHTPEYAFLPEWNIFTMENQLMQRGKP